MCCILQYFIKILHIFHSQMLLLLCYIYFLLQIKKIVHVCGFPASNTVIDYFSKSPTNTRVQNWKLHIYVNNILHSLSRSLICRCWSEASWISCSNANQYIFLAMFAVGMSRIIVFVFKIQLLKYKIMKACDGNNALILSFLVYSFACHKSRPISYIFHAKVIQNMNQKLITI